MAAHGGSHVEQVDVAWRRLWPVGSPHKLSLGRTASCVRDPHAEAGEKSDCEGAADDKVFWTATFIPHSPTPLRENVENGGWV